MRGSARMLGSRTGLILPLAIAAAMSVAACGDSGGDTSQPSKTRKPSSTGYLQGPGQNRFHPEYNDPAVARDAARETCRDLRMDDIRDSLVTWENSQGAAEVMVQAANFLCPDMREVIAGLASLYDWVEVCADDDVACDDTPIPRDDPLREPWARPLD